MRKYEKTYRRSLLDMHIPGWDPDFLSRYEPASLADEYARAGVEGVLLYCKSHMGLNYWPAPVGGIHPAAAERDLVGDLVDALRERDIRPAAYHSVVFDNWAAENHPDWRQLSPASLRGTDNVAITGVRYGTMCMNNAEYLAYELEQITALVQRYDFDALWIDMVFWTTICVCESCQKRCRSELGFEVPQVIDWTSAEWSRFQEARTRWLDEFWRSIRAAVRAVRPELAITHNLAPELYGWYLGGSTDEFPEDTFAAGDLYGGRDQQLFVSRLMHTISTGAQGEYMTSRSPDLRYHVQLRSERELLLQALGATSQHLAFLFIDAIDPIGTVQKGTYDRIRDVFAVTRSYEDHLGGTPVSDVALYFSPRNRTSPDENGSNIWAPSAGRSPYDAAFDGACAALQAAHVPFGIVTRATLGQLDKHRVLVLPNVSRLDDEELSAFREFVRAGGRVYASGLTSLGGVYGERFGEFALGDVLGVRAGRPYQGNIVFLKPQVPHIETAASPEAYVSWGLQPREVLPHRKPPQALDIPLPAGVTDGADVWATVTLPYAYPDFGSLQGHRFASIHSSPPWTDTETPAIVRNSFGAGESLYCVAPIETAGDVSSRALFTELILHLLHDDRRIEATAPPAVWITLFDQLDQDRMILSVLNYEPQAGMTADVSVIARAPAGYDVVGVTRTTDDTDIEYELVEKGRGVKLDGLSLPLFEQLEISLAGPRES
ncbi:alpha-amylase family protein [Jiangella asiatica]|uniref:Beta-galactosidase trimerisation domain-containing protein n=1 Tax=Jiangella asiatica TaxID=2530372 RepID=A0A4R5DTS2_9ACTN|nr:alpha-amylase family protein [Jiangella asiatica]TDE14293.1 hypothetical protein E1269_03820 [Jiangella asiatica]